MLHGPHKEFSAGFIYFKATHCFQIFSKNLRECTEFDKNGFLYYIKYETIEIKITLHL